MRKAITIIALALSLGGCASMNVQSSVAGSCQVFSDPGFRVRGLTSRDERWIARTQETGIQICHWKRPARASYKVDCPTVRQIVAAFSGDAARAEQYARSQGASSRQLTQARACLTTSRR